MKRDCFDHPKVVELAEDLGICTAFARGVLESLWIWSAKHARDGALRFRPSVVANGIGYQGDSNALFSALQANWIDTLEDGTLYIHDWHEHCEDSVHLSLFRAGLQFANGMHPNPNRLSDADKAKIRADHAEKQAVKSPESTKSHGVRTESAQDAHGVRTESAPAYALAEADLRSVKPPNRGRAHVQEPCQPEQSESGSADACASSFSAGHPDRREPEPPPEGRALPGRPVPTGRSVEHGAHPSGQRATGAQSAAQILSRIGLDGGRREALLLGIAQRIMPVTHEPEGYRPYWHEVLKRMDAAGGLDHLEDCLRTLEVAADPAQRKAKDIGEFKHPGAWLTKQCHEFLKVNGGRMPPPPKCRR